MKNIGYILEEAGYTFENVVKSTCLLSDIANFAEMNGRCTVDTIKKTVLQELLSL